MHRDNWNGVFENQDRILKQLKPLENEMFLAGGTGLQRFVLPKAYRHSEDLKSHQDIKDTIICWMLQISSVDSIQKKSRLRHRMIYISR